MQITTSCRTWRAAAHAMQDGVVLSVHPFTISVKRRGDTLSSATVDGHSDAPTTGKARTSRLRHTLAWVLRLFTTSRTTFRRTVQPSNVQFHVGA